MDTQTAVASGEAGEEVGNAMGIDSASKTAGEPVAVEGMHGEIVDIDAAPKEKGYREADEEEEQETMLALDRGAVWDGHAPRDEGGENEKKSNDKDGRRDFGEHFEEDSGRWRVRVFAALGACASCGEHARDRGAKPPSPDGVTGHSVIGEEAHKMRTQECNASNGEPASAEQEG